MREEIKKGMHPSSAPFMFVADTLHMGWIVCMKSKADNERLHFQYVQLSTGLYVDEALFTWSDMPIIYTCTREDVNVFSEHSSILGPSNGLTEITYEIF